MNKFLRNIYLGRYIFLQSSFLQSKIPQISSNGDYLQKKSSIYSRIELKKTNDLRESFARDFSKKNMVVCMCVCVFLNFLVCEMETTKKHENNLSKIADT